MRASMLALVREGAAEQTAKDRRAWERQQRAIQQRTLDKLLQQEQEQVRAKELEPAQNDSALETDSSSGPQATPSSSSSAETLGPAFGPARPPPGFVNNVFCCCGIRLAKPFVAKICPCGLKLGRCPRCQRFHLSNPL